MAHRRPTNRELRETLDSALAANKQLRAANAEMRRELDALIRKNEHFQAVNEELMRRLVYYENASSPPSVRSLEYKARRRRIKEEKKSAPDGDKKPPRGKPGGVKGHKGTLRSHNPERTVHHGFGDGAGKDGDLPVCGCGSRMDRTAARIRDIIEIPTPTFTETRHVIETARCPGCGATAEAENDLPAAGSYGKNLVGAIAEIRAARVPLKLTAGVVAAVCGVAMAKSTVTNVLGGVADRMEPEANGIIGEIMGSGRVNIDETSYWSDGSQIWAWAMVSGEMVGIVLDKSRGVHVMDLYMDGYQGVPTTDGYGVYKRFDPGGRHQICWAHEPGNTRHLADNPLKIPGDGGAAARLHEDLKWMFERAKGLLGQLPHSTALRRTMEVELALILDRYRRISDKRLQKMLSRLERFRPFLFTFMEYPGVEPTNNAAERALRPVVVFRKISGQIKGGVRSMKRMSSFLTCILTWKAQGRRIGAEVARLI